ncbi:MAG: histidine phosphatase family protein [Acidobacteriaceae bacterium]
MQNRPYEPWTMGLLVRTRLRIFPLLRETWEAFSLLLSFLMNIFYLVRHAHAEWTLDEQRPLSSRGCEDASKVMELLCDQPISGIYSSPYQRAIQTVLPLASKLGLPIQGEPDLRERSLGDAPGVKDFYTAVMMTWQDPSFSFPGGETNAMAQLRGVAIVERLARRYPGGHVVLSTHGNLLALVLKHFDARIDYVFWKELTMPDIYMLCLSPGEEPAITRLWQQ